MLLLFDSMLVKEDGVLMNWVRNEEEKKGFEWIYIGGWVGGDRESKVSDIGEREREKWCMIIIW